MTANTDKFSKHAKEAFRDVAALARKNGQREGVSLGIEWAMSAIRATGECDDDFLTAIHINLLQRALDEL